jgi:hypothetical protein
VVAVSRTLGDAWVNILPQLDRFQAYLRAGLKKSLAGVNAEIPVTLSTLKLDAQIAAAKLKIATLRDQGTGLKLDADTKALYAKIAAAEAKLATLQAQGATLKIGADDKAFDATIAGVEAKIAGLKSVSSDLKVDFDLTAAAAKIADLQLQAHNLEHAIGDMTADIQIEAAELKLAAIRAQVAFLSSEAENMRLDFDLKKADAQLAAEVANLSLLKSSARDIVLAANANQLDAQIAAQQASIEALKETAGTITPAMKTDKLDAQLAFERAKLDELTKKREILISVDTTTDKTFSTIAGSLVTLTGAADQAGAATGRTAAGVGLLGGAFRGGWGALVLLNARIPLFAGLLDGILPKFAQNVAVWHLGADALVELIAVWGGAAIAAGAFAVAASDAVTEVYQRLLELHTVADATGQSIPPLTGALEKLHDAVRPDVYQVFGDALDVVKTHTGEFATLVTGTATVVDHLAGRMTAALTSGTAFNVFTRNAVASLAGLGTAFGNVFGAIGNVINVIPGYAEVLLGLGVGFTGLLESVTRVLEPVLRLGLAIHGALIYIGVAVTAVVALTGPLIALGTGFFTAAAGAAGYAAVLVSLASSEGIAAAAGVALSDVPVIVWAGLAAAAITGLILVLRGGAGATQQWTDGLIKMADAVPVVHSLAANLDAQAAAAAQLSAATAKLSDITQTQTVFNGHTGIASQQVTQAYRDQQGVVNTLQAAVGTLNGQRTLELSRISPLAKAYGGTTAALGLLNAAGITTAQITKDQGQAWAIDSAQIQGTIAGYKAMTGTAGQMNNDMDVLGRTLTDQYTAVQKLNQGWGTFISDLTSTQDSFDTVALGIVNLNVNFAKAGGTGETLTNTLGKLKLKGDLTGATMDGLSQASLDLNQAFATQVVNTGKLYDSWRTAGIANSDFVTGVKDSIAPLVKYAAGSQEATAQLVGLAQEAGYHGPVSMAELVKWLGNVKDATQNVKDITDQATVQEALLTGAMQAQGAYIANSLIGDINNAILKYDGVHQAAIAYGDAIAQDGKNSDDARAARQRLIDDLIKSGQAAGESKDQIAALIAKVLAIPLSRAIDIVLSTTGKGEITITGTGINTRVMDTHGGLVGMAGGGYISAGSGPTADDVPIMASKGELVVPAAMVKSGAVSHLRGRIPGFAGGGIVGAISGAGSAEADFGSAAVGAFAQAALQASSAAAAAAAAKASFTSGPAATGSAAAAQAFARSILPAGWSWPALLSLWNQECTPLGTLILTRHGWLAHDEVRPGDETIGYNPATGRSEWTAVTRVVHYEDAEVWRIGGSRWHADVTPGHRWWSDYRRNNGRGYVTEHAGFVRTAELAPGDRIRLAARADTDGIPGLSTEDAAVLAWMQGDGHIRAAHPGQDRGYDGRIYQSKPEQVTRLRALLAHVEHTESAARRAGRPESHLAERFFLLRRGYVTDLVKRSEVMETGPEQMVLRMSPDQRAAWLAAMIDAEGTAKGNFTLVYQNPGELAEAIRLAIYLEGYRPSMRHNNRDRLQAIGMGNPHVATHRFKPYKVLDRQPVFCVTTELGSWTAKQDSRVFLTGNSGWNAYAVNASSGAYGIPQALGKGHPYNLGDYANQIRWGISYIAGRYGNSQNAWSHEQAFNWYKAGGLVGDGKSFDSGGWLSPGINAVRNNTGRPEHLTPTSGGLSADARHLGKKIDQLITATNRSGANFRNGLNGAMTAGASQGYYGSGFLP